MPNPFDDMPVRNTGDVLPADQLNAIRDLLLPLDRTAAEIAAGVTPVNYEYPERNVKRYGAVGNGIADDATAINNAIKVINDWTVYSASIGDNNGLTADHGRSGTVFFPSGIYRVTSPILLAPGVRLLGQSPIGNRGANLSATTHAIIRADFPPGEEWYVIDTGTWRYKVEATGDPVGTPTRAVDADDQFIFATDKDNGYGAWMSHCFVDSIVIDGNDTAFGGIRIQVASNFRLDNFYISGTKYAGLTTAGCYEFTIGGGVIYAPVPWYIVGCESGMQDTGELWLGSAPSSFWASGNQTLINSVFYPYADQVGSWYDLTRKCILAQWSLNFTLGYLFIGYCDVGIEAYRANFTILHLEAEFSEEAGFLLRGSHVTVDSYKGKNATPLATGDQFSRLVLREPHLLAHTSSFTPITSETSSDFEIQIYNPHAQPDVITSNTTRFSTINKTRVYPYTGLVNLHVSTSGDVANDGLKSTARTTINGALRWIVNNPHVREWVINLADDQTHTISEAFTISDGTRVRFIRDNLGSAAAILSMSTALTVRDGAKIELINAVLSSYSTNSAFLVRGAVSFEISSATVTIPDNKVIWECATNTTAHVTATGWAITTNFGSGAGLCSGGSNGFVNYEDSFVTAGGTGTAALEAITTGKVTKIASNLV